MDLHARTGVALAAALGVWAVLMIAPPVAAQAEEQAPEPAATAADEPADGNEGNADQEVPTRALTGPLRLLPHPVYPPEQVRLIYQPLIDYLNRATGYKFELVVSRNFHRYWLDARRGDAPELVFEDAHMVAWRMQNFDYHPLVTARGARTYSLLTSGALADDSLSGFVGRRISSLPAPSLGYLLLANWFDNPLQQPQILSTATSWLDAVEMVFSAEADAAIAPDTLASKYPNLYPVATSPELPGVTLAASAEVPDDIRAEIIDALTRLEDNTESQSVLFELDIDGFDASNPADFENLEEWLDPIFSL